VLALAQAAGSTTQVALPAGSGRQRHQQGQEAEQPSGHRSIPPQEKPRSSAEKWKELAEEEPALSKPEAQLLVSEALPAAAAVHVASADCRSSQAR